VGRVHLLEVDGYAGPPLTVVLSPYTPFSQPKRPPAMVGDSHRVQYLQNSAPLIPVCGDEKPL
jgi:hypothetical protein